MSKVKIKLNRSGVKELLQSSAMQQVCREHAERVKTRCGDGYEMDSRVGRNRVNARVWADTPAAQQDNLKNNTIQKALK